MSTHDLELELTSGAEPGAHGSDEITTLPMAIAPGKVRVRVRPHYLPQRSDPLKPMHVFAYAVTIQLEAPPEAPSLQLVDRMWRIIDAHGVEELVEGEGVVGQQPVLRPGERFEYASYCPLRTRWGTMEGRLGLVPLDEADRPGDRFLADVGRFYLVSQ